jgi:YidC/Oxa1 family membrane protein insertase
MDEEATTRRTMIAVAASVGLLVLWQVVFPPKKAKEIREKPPMVAASSTTAASSTSSVASAIPGVRVPEDGTGEVAPPPEERFFRFEGSVDGPQGNMPYTVKLTNYGGAIQDFRLTRYRERDKSNRATKEHIRLAAPWNAANSKTPHQMAGIRFAEGTTFSSPAVIPFSVAEESADRVLYRYRSPEGVVIEREYKFSPESFSIELAVTVRNESDSNQTHNLELDAALRVSEAMTSGGGILSSFVPPPDHLDTLCRSDDVLEREHYQSMRGEPSVVFDRSVQWVAVDRQYFLAAMVPRDRDEARCVLQADGKMAVASLALKETTLRPGESKRHKLTAYLGVKRPSLLTQLNVDLEDAVDYRILFLDLAPLCTGLLWILALLHGWTNSWGLAIVGLTLLVKLVLFPLNQKSGRSMRAMAQLKPKMDELKTKFANDRQRQSEEMLRLYRTHNVNPAGGCLPVLFQMPIWFALYRSLWVSVDLYQQKFLWIGDLTTRDPYWILPVALTAVMFLQQKLTPTTMDPAQQRVMMYMMPLMFGAMMVALPAGLCFYILVNTVLTIVQQHLINKSVGPIEGNASVQGVAA